MLSKDNYYMISYKNEKTNIKIKIEKDYNLINMWNDNSKDGAISYNLYVSSWDKTYTEENIKIEKAYEALLPYLREIKIEKVGI